jgi:cellulose 1,4-beta-cellobiosidase
VTGLGVEYDCANTNASSQNLQPHFEVINNGSTSVDLTTLTLRYYFTKDGCSDTLTSDCDYATLGCGVISVAFNTATGTNADEYAEVSFASGTLAPGASTGEIQPRLHAVNYTCTFTQTNDYSFDPTKTSYTYWSNVTLYQGGTLVWGTEP